MTVSDEPFVAVAETHSAAVVFVGDLAYKVKKPVALGFLDWRNHVDRSQAIDDELRLNQRLAADVYLGTSTLPRPGGVGEPVLVMRRLPTTRRLSALVRRGDNLDSEVREIATQLARFHQASPESVCARTAAGPAANWQRWVKNHQSLRGSFERWIDAAEAEAVLQQARRYIEGRHELFAARVRDGRARDGHGDLLADDIFCLDDGPRILDCLDFDESLRVGDVLADIAFLAMDLERLERPDLAWRFLQFHRELTADTWPRSLAHHYIAYRAQVRTLVACVRADQGDPAAGEQAADLLALASRNLAAGRVRLIVVGGPPATGKSTLAGGIGERLAVPVLRSDTIRKELAGIAVATHAAASRNAGIYSREWTERTYTGILSRAGRLLRGGQSVVVDATWSEGRHRALARAIAERDHAEVVELRCTVPTAVAQSRAARRALEGTDVSDADATMAAALAEDFEQWPSATEISTNESPAVSLQHALAVVEA